MIDSGKGETRSTRKMKIFAFILVAIMVASTVSMMVPSALETPEAQDDGNSSTSGWSPNPDPNGAREAVYKFDHWGENYLKNEQWNGTTADLAPYTRLNVSMATLGHHGIFTGDSTRLIGNPTGMGVSDWLNGTSYRTGSYGEYGVRTDRYPYIFANDPNSHETTGVEAQLDWIVWTPYRITGTIKNESMARTGDGGPASGTLHHNGRAWFVPKLGPEIQNGGYINATYYGTYLTGMEVTRIKNPQPAQQNVHYAQWFYGASGAFLSGNNDGYFYEIQGWINYSRQAAVAYLGYTDASGDIRTWYASNKAALETAWIKDWQWNGSNEGSPGVAQQNGTRGLYNVYTNYEYHMNNSGMFNLITKIDTKNSTYRTIALRLYSISWGGESLMMRLMERCNATGFFSNTSIAGGARPGSALRGSMVDYSEDLYWNITAGPSKADMFFRMVTLYRLTAWEDPSSSVFMGGWMLEAFHTDYMGNGPGGYTLNSWSYLSPFNRYDPDMYVGIGTLQMNERTTMSRVPGTRKYTQNVSYWTTPVLRNFSKYECFIFDLNMSHSPAAAGRDFIGINPSWVGDPTQRTSGILADNVANNNFTANMYWGRLKLGDYCTPFPIVKGGSAYDPLTQVLNISGGSASGAGTVGIYMEQYTLSGRDYWRATGANYAYQNGKVYAHGTPFIMLDVVPVDNYVLDITGAHMTQMDDIVKVTAVNGTGAVVTNWNGTVTLSSTDGVFGANGSSHTFVPADNGVWWTTINWSASGAGVQTITAQDTTNSTTSFTDIVTRASVTVILYVPEFTDVLIPVIGMAAIFFVVRTKKRKSET